MIPLNLSREIMPVGHATKGELFGHPKGLYILFFTEMWERFSYYGMRALLVLYMVNYFKWNQQEASSIYKWYTSLVYLTPLLGGYLADRYLGNKRAIIIGASLMALGHFCMAFEQHELFYAALVLLIIGNGFFKPNMSVQVGRLYAANDPRRDSAYTIFYMGINLGAFLSPIICGWLRLNTRWEYHAGFAAAGVGMVLGLVVYLVGLKWVQEIPEGVEYEAAMGGDTESKPESENHHYMSEKEAQTAPSVFSLLSEAAPVLFGILGILAIVGSGILWQFDVLEWDDAIAFGLGGAFCASMGAYILSHVSMALRDRVVVIFLVGVFVVVFWAAFEQAGNAMNIHADKTTDRYVTETAPEPSLYPEVAKADAVAAEGSAAEAAPKQSWGEKWRALWNPVTPEWFQSINALAIFILAPFFAWLWVYLPRCGINLSIPAKMSLGVFLMGMAGALMYWSVSYENQPSSTPLTSLPQGVSVDERGRVVFRDAPELKATDGLFAAFGDVTEDIEDPKVVHGKRIFFDAVERRLTMTGVLSDTDRDRLLRATVSSAYLASMRELANLSNKFERKEDEEMVVWVTLQEPPAGLDLRYAGQKEGVLHFDESTGELTTTEVLADRDFKMLLVAGADAEFRDALNELYLASAKFKVTPMWLFAFYILATLGELCLSPVGLSMVSKLAPARFATMLMGVWLMTSFFGNYLAGFAGENYGIMHPESYFLFVTVFLLAASFVCFVFVRFLRSMMHGVM